MSTSRDREAGPYAPELTSAITKLGLKDSTNIDTEEIEKRLRVPQYRKLITADELDALSAYFNINLEKLDFLPRKTTNPRVLDELRAIERGVISRMAARGILPARPKRGK